MKRFKEKITLNRNSRGCYILDTVKGCSITKTRPRGCYGDCYAQGIASRYGMDFGSPVKRDFERNNIQPSLFGFDDSDHVSELVKSIRAIEMPFVRIGEMGDPSEDWEHTISVCNEIAIAEKPIVIITKHWKPLPDNLLLSLSGICINTSVSAMDDQNDLKYRLAQYERLKPFCKSVLRVVSCDFNTDNEDGARMKMVQDSLLSSGKVIETVFRPSAKNEFLTGSIIKAEKVKFLRATVLASLREKGAYIGRCETCPDMCGLTLTDDQL